MGKFCSSAMKILFKDEFPMEKMWARWDL